jgi:hypothetical protein
MEKSVVIVILIVLVLPVVSAGWWDDFKESIGLSPAPTDVSVTVNTAPTIVPSSIIVDGDGTIDFDTPNENVILLSGSLINDVAVQFQATDPDPSPGDLDDSTATARFTKSGELPRPAVAQACLCTVGCGTAATRTYECNLPSNQINMEYYDDNAADWTVTVYIEDNLNEPVTGTVTDVFTVELLRSITASGVGSPIAFGVVTSPDSDVNNIADLEITNLGNYDTTGGGLGDGYVQVQGYDLRGDTITSEAIGAVNFEANDGDGSLNCLPGLPTSTQLGPLNGDILNIDSLDLPKGDGTGGNNIGDMETCLRSVPGSLSSQVFSARNNHPECIASSVACAWNIILP